ncbi:hypothetical protein MOQ_006671 [Trypanosoma cruzi marinkellei]|uniref:Uncharacterized protein n=1 Tax=Trypanosoma cruzi marinkellei TaxID=85056 RepID=K2N4G0_TRYCR|nr:hypothetical protein MOQ_006671 [Trypanosoma cruzi marinkellei]
MLRERRQAVRPVAWAVSRADRLTSSGEILMSPQTRLGSLRTASLGSGMLVAAFLCIDCGVVSKQIAPRMSSIHRRLVRHSFCVGARAPTIICSGAGLAAGGTKLSLLLRVGQAMPCSCRSAALPGCRAERGPDTMRLPRRRGATHGGCIQPDRNSWCDGTPQPKSLRPAAADGGATRSALQRRGCAIPELECRPIALPRRRTGWKLTRGFPSPRRWSAVSSSDCRRSKMQNSAARSSRRCSPGCARQLALPQHRHGCLHPRQQACGCQRT